MSDIITILPKWLPDMFCVDPWTEHSFEDLYEIFKSDFIASKPKFNGKVVNQFQEKENGIEQIFWHITHTKDHRRQERLPDFERCKRLPWAKPVIENNNEPEILYWDYKEGKSSSIRTYIWLKDYDYIIILKKVKTKYYFLHTAFYVSKSKRIDLMQRYEKRVT